MTARVALYSENCEVVIGVTRSKTVFLASPNVDHLVEFEYSSASLSINKSIKINDDKFVEPVFTLECIVESTQDLWAISSLFSGLTNLILKNSHSQEVLFALEGIEQYFAEQFKAMKSNREEIGLFGELVFIFAHVNVDLGISSWHSSKLSNYDFALPGLQVEVKTSTVAARSHRLRSSQSLLHGSNLFYYASVYAPVLQVGTTIKEIEKLISLRASRASASIFFEKLNQYNRTSYQCSFDLQTAVGSILWVSSGVVPTPLIEDFRIRDVNWTCDFTQLDSEPQPSTWHEMSNV